MIIMRIEGGLGNVMFQYALGRFLSLKNKTDLKYEISSCKINPLGDYSMSLEAFHINIHENLIDNKTFKKFKRYKKRLGRRYFFHNLFADEKKYITDKYFRFDPEIMKIKDNVFLHGWWQTEKYFKDIRDILLKDFEVVEPLSGKNKEISDLIQKTNSVSIHIRRCDYVTNPKTKAYHGELTKEYYDNALKYLVTHGINDPHIFIFSDDIEWVKKNMPFPFITHYISWNRNLPHEDIRLMSLCKHNIIANSTLGWWGAWLNQNRQKIVIGPKTWFANSPQCDTRDILPEDWVKI